MRTRKLALLVLLLLLGLAFWLWRGHEAPPTPPLNAPQAQAAKPVAQPESPVETTREALAPATTEATTLLIVICRAQETGAPLANQLVHLSEVEPHNGIVPQGKGAHGKLGEMLTTGADGRVEYEIAPGVPARLWVAPQDRVSNATAKREIVALAAGEHREVVVEIATQAVSRFCARVIARATRQPIAGIEVLGSPGTLVTDADGRFELTFANWSMERLSIVAIGYAEVRVVPQEGHATPEQAQLIELDRSGTLVGLLRDAGGSDKPGRLRMRVWTEGYHLGAGSSSFGSDSDDPNWMADFDATGRAEIPGLPPDAPLRVSVLEGNHPLLELAEPITIPPGGTREVELRPASNCRLTGIVRDDAGALVPGLTLWLLRTDGSPRSYLESYEKNSIVAQAKTGDDGRFAFEKVAPGSWRLGPEARFRSEDVDVPVDVIAPVAIVLEIPKGTAAQEVELVVHRGLAIRGRVLDPDGQPATQCGVSAFAPPSCWVSANCRSDGSFVLGPLAPGSYGLETHPWPMTGLAPSEPVQAECGASDVVLRLRAGSKLAGRVVDASSGEGVVAKIAISIPGDKKTPIYMPRSKPDGSFELGGLLAGSYALAATTADGRTGVLRAVDLGPGARSQGLTISVVPGARLRVRYEGAQGFVSVHVEQAGIVFDADGIKQGTVQQYVAPAGAVRVVARLGGNGREIVKELTLKAGDEQELVIKDDD